MAVCEYALDTKEDEKLTEDFFELIFSAFDCNVEVGLNAEEYEFWWEKVMQVCDRVAEFSGAGWAQKGAQYSEARYGKRDVYKRQVFDAFQTFLSKCVNDAFGKYSFRLSLIHI